MAGRNALNGLSGLYFEFILLLKKHLFLASLIPTTNRSRLCCGVKAFCNSNLAKILVLARSRLPFINLSHFEVVSWILLVV